MRINRLELAGFGPYKNAQTVDFDSFADDGIFLISGKTGAGKSSILDAICFALYNSVPRYDGTQTQLRSHHCEPDDPSFVQLDFTVGTTQYRVRRTPEYERPKARGTGTTTQKAGAELSVWRDGDWQGIAARPVDVATELATIVNLSKDQFLQVILLAQNRFQQFLLAKNDDRQDVLRTLFGTDRFQRYEAAIIERSKQLVAQLGDALEDIDRSQQRALDLVGTDTPLVEPVETPLVATSLVEPAETRSTYPDTDGALALALDPGAAPDAAWFAAALAILTDALEQATATVDAARSHLESAERTHSTLLDARRRQTRRDTVRETLQRLDAERDEIDTLRAELAAATRASTVWPQVETRRGAAELLEQAILAESAAHDAFAHFAEPAGDENVVPDAASLTVLIDELARSLGALDEVLRDEQQLPTLDESLATLVAQLTQLDDALTANVARREALPGLTTLLGEKLTAARVAAGRAADAEASVTRLTAAHAAAVEAAALEPRVQVAQRAELGAVKAHTAASARFESLLTARLAGHAAELALALVDGEPCAVCGATEHPTKAEPTGELVTEADIEQAREELDEKRQAMDAARDVARQLADELTEARARAEQRTVEALEQELAAARQAVADAQAAADDAAALERQQIELQTELSELTGAEQSLRTEREQAEAERVRVQTSRSELAERIGRHRGEHDSVAARAARLRAHLEAAKSLDRAIADRATREHALASATTALGAQLAEHGFDSEHAVAEARLSAGEQEAHDTRIRKHEQGTATARATLAEPELADLPAEPVETDAAAEAVAAASATLSEATATRGSVRERHAQLEKLVAEVESAFEASAALRDEYEQVRALADAVQGGPTNTKRMRLETYVLAAQLEEIVAAANGRLRTMTAGRYELQHDDSVQYRNTRSGLGLAILDQHTGRARATHSLSGGETFLASLALALGLAEVVTNQAGGIALDTLFVDEGFGSLDADTLEIAMSTLDSLRAGGRTIGLISHVEAMKEQIPAKLRITVTESGCSEIAGAAS